MADVSVRMAEALGHLRGTLEHVQGELREISQSNQRQEERLGHVSTELALVHKSLHQLEQRVTRIERHDGPPPPPLAPVTDNRRIVSWVVGVLASIGAILAGAVGVSK